MLPNSLNGKEAGKVSCIYPVHMAGLAWREVTVGVKYESEKRNILVGSWSLV
jgi:hypothetical protein